MLLLCVLFALFYASKYHFYSPAQLGQRFHRQQASGQAVVPGVFPSPPRYVSSFLSRIRFSVFSAFQVVMLVDFRQISQLDLRSRAFGPSICNKESFTRLEPTTSTTISPRFVT